MIITNGSKFQALNGIAVIIRVIYALMQSRYIHWPVIIDDSDLETGNGFAKS